MHDRGQAVYDDHGTPLRMIGTMADITDRKLADAALRENRERLQAALSASRTGTFRWDIRTSSLHWDENLDRLFGLPPGQTAPSLPHFISRVHPDDRPAVTAACERCAADGTDFDLEFRVVWPDGSVHWLDDKGKTFPHPDGKPAYMTGACVDITDRKQAVLALADSESRFRQLADAVPTMAWVAAPDGTVDYFNTSWYQYTGLPAERSLGQAWANSLHSDDLDAVARKWAASIQTGTPFENEHRFRRHDG